MAASFGALTGQSAGGQHIAVTTAQTVHTVPSGETHRVTVLGTATTNMDVTVKVDGETTGAIITVPAKEQRVVWTGVVVGNASTSIVELTASTGTLQACGEYVKLA